MSAQERIEYHNGYMIEKLKWTGEIKCILIIERVITTRGSVKREFDVKNFLGDTQDEADAAMIAWIEEHGATMKDAHCPKCGRPAPCERHP